jgi:hypothetical protein
MPRLEGHGGLQSSYSVSNRLRSRALTAGINHDEAVQARVIYLGTDRENLTKAEASLAEAGVTTLIGVSPVPRRQRSKCPRV